MKLFVVLMALIGLNVALGEHRCEDVFSEEECMEYHRMELDDDVNVRNRRQLPPPDGGDNDVLVNLIKEKLKFFIGLGVFNNLPFFDIVRDLINRDPDGVARALKDGIFGAMKLMQMVLGAAALGR